MANQGDELLDYEDQEDTNGASTMDTEKKIDDEDDSGIKDQTDDVQGSYAAVSSSSFGDLLLAPEVLRAVEDAGFEHPSEVQHNAIPTAIMGKDLICQAKSGMGKTAVFVIATLQQIAADKDIMKSQDIDTVVLAHTRELAFQISKEFDRFSKYLKPKDREHGLRYEVVYGGIPFHTHKAQIENTRPHVLIGTPGRILHLLQERAIDLSKIKRFVLDECDNMLDQLDMRRQVQDIFKKTPHDKQVMLFSATISPDSKRVCRLFTKQNVQEIFVDDKKLTLHGLCQHYVELPENDKIRKLNALLDALDFNQVVIFVNTTKRAETLAALLVKSGFPCTQISSRMPQEKRIQVYQDFKDYRYRVLVATNLFGRGIDIERVNIVVNYDMPPDDNEYLHRVGRAGRFGTKGLAISFVTDKPAEGGPRGLYSDKEVLKKVQERFKVKITPLPNEIDKSVYMNTEN